MCSDMASDSDRIILHFPFIPEKISIGQDSFSWYQAEDHVDMHVSCTL